MKKIIFSLFTVFAFALTINAQQYDGTWAGNLEIQNTKLPIVFHIQKSGENYSATMDSPKQNAFGMKVKSTTVSNNKIILDMSDIGIMFEGILKTDSILGQFAQSGMTFPLNLSKTKDGAFTTPKRPQEPKPKFNYEIQDVMFTNEAEKIKLAGTLTLPKGKGPFPAVVLVSGSGPQNRDEEIMGHKPFWVIADYLTKNGIAVLRYDDRGTAQSEGNFKTATTANFAGDAQAAVEFLRTQKKIKSDKVGVIGHSEGGMIAPMMAAKDPKIAFIVLLAGPGIPIDELMLIQTELGLRSEGIPEKEIKSNMELNKQLFQMAKQEKDPQKAYDQIYEVLQKISKDSTSILYDTSDVSGEIKKIAYQVTEPWFHYFISYDPQPSIAQVQCPVLAINGDKDVQVTSKENLAGIQQALKQGGNDKFEIHEMKNMNHLFQTTTNGAVSEYAKIEETFAPEVMKLMADWIKKLK